MIALSARFLSLCVMAGAMAAPAVSAQERYFYPTTATASQDGFPGGATSLADVTYSSIPGYRPMIVDNYLPPRELGPRPLLQYVHGGSWVGGNTRHGGATADFPAALAKLAEGGLVVASLEYGLASEAVLPAQAHDVRAALRFLKGHAAHYIIDPSRTGIWGGSAGGHLSALAALGCGDGSVDPAGATAATGNGCNRQ